MKTVILIPAWGGGVNRSKSAPLSYSVDSDDKNQPVWQIWSWSYDLKQTPIKNIFLARRTSLPKLGPPKSGKLGCDQNRVLADTWSPVPKNTSPSTTLPTENISRDIASTIPPGDTGTEIIVKFTIILQLFYNYNCKMVDSVVPWVMVRLRA